VTYFALASYFKLNIGHRHLLPMYPFLFVFSSRAVAVVEKNCRLLSWAFSALLVWYVVEAIRIYPDYLAYFNEFAGGPRNGYQPELCTSEWRGRDDGGKDRLGTPGNIG